MDGGFSWKWVLALVALVGGCQDEDSYYLMSEIYEVDGSERELAGGGCMAAVFNDGGGSASGSASGGPAANGGAPDFAFQETTEGDGVRVRVFSAGELIEEREYSEFFLRSQAVDRFEVVTHGGRTYEFAYWGGPDCDTSHLPVD